MHLPAPLALLRWARGEPRVLRLATRLVAIAPHAVLLRERARGRAVRIVGAREHPQGQGGVGSGLDRLAAGTVGRTAGGARATIAAANSAAGALSTLDHCLTCGVRLRIATALASQHCVTTIFARALPALCGHRLDARERRLARARGRHPGAAHAAIGLAIALLAALSHAIAAARHAVIVVARVGSFRAASIAIRGGRDGHVNTPQVAIVGAPGGQIAGAGVLVVASVRARLSLARRLAGLALRIDDAVTTARGAIRVVALVAAGRAATVVGAAHADEGELAACVAALCRPAQSGRDAGCARNAGALGETALRRITGFTGVYDAIATARAIVIVCAAHVWRATAIPVLRLGDLVYLAPALTPAARQDRRRAAILCVAPGGARSRVARPDSSVTRLHRLDGSVSAHPRDLE